jgi:hypothetical protein
MTKEVASKARDTIILCPVMPTFSANATIRPGRFSLLSTER